MSDYFPHLMEHSYDFYIRGIALGLRYRNDRKLAEYDITNPQARLLGIIGEGLKSGVDVTRRYLEEVTLLRGPSVTSLLNGLEKKGFIARSTSGEDARAIDITITPKAERLIRDMADVFVESDERLLRDMSVEERGIFLRLLAKAYGNIVEGGS